MKKQMSNRLKVGLIFAILVATATFATVWVIVNQPRFPNFEPRGPPPTNFIPGDLEFFYAAFTILSTINIALLVILTLIYTDIYVKTRSQFTIGLVIFALVFLVKDLTSSPLVISLFRFRAYGLGPFEFLPGLFEFVALSILLYLTVRY
jgi:hypothetical protein